MRTAMLTISRLIIGLGVGLSSATVPTYLSELAPSRLTTPMPQPTGDS